MAAGTLRRRTAGSSAGSGLRSGTGIAWSLCAAKLASRLFGWLLDCADWTPTRLKEKKKLHVADAIVSC